MADTTLAALGSSVIVSPDNDEEIIPALGNGALYPGDLVSIATATGRVVGADLGGSELVSGIIMEHPVLGTDAVITTDLACSIVIPRSGHRYRCRCKDLNAATEIGSGLDISDTAGKLDAAADINNAICTVSLPNADGDTIVEVRWR